MRTKTQEKIQLAKRYYGKVYIQEYYNPKDLLEYMKLKHELFEVGYFADERNKEVVFKKIEC